MKKEEVIRKLQENKEKIKSFGVKKIGIFGSVVRDEASKNSDIDILVEFYKEAKISLLDFVELENTLSDLLGKKVDLVEKSSLRKKISQHILKEVEYLWEER